MATTMVWNPTFTEEVSDRIFQQLNTYYNPESIAHLLQQLKEQQGQHLEAIFPWLYQQMTEAQQPTVVAVTEEIVHQRLMVANAAIAFVKAHLPFGAGNQLQAWCASHGNAKMRKDAGKMVSKFGQREIEGGPKQKTKITTGSATLVALTTQGGTCRDYAALTREYLLAQRVPEGDIHLWSIKTGDHILVVLGDPEKEPDTAVAVDAWPTHAQATMWRNHFAFGKDKGESTLIQDRTASPLNLTEGVATLANKLTNTSEDLNPILFTFTPCCNAAFTRTVYTFNQQTLQIPVQSDPPVVLKNKEEEAMRLNPLQGRTNIGPWL